MLTASLTFAGVLSGLAVWVAAAGVLDRATGTVLIGFGVRLAVEQ